MDPRGHPRLLGETLGVVVFQDMVQKYGRASKATVPLFVSDAAAMVHGRRNHPSILQWTAFNEGDCWEVFDTPPHDVAGVVALFKRLEPTVRDPGAFMDAAIECACGRGAIEPAARR